eukprot:TRINITY_DN80564_c0_g1_i1.p1 TRINITY_DN80564_c0_g1~~TRINITY_DN80564_c0_g1_i1.p1  ORF type:complete len:739 (-),score=108.79 TRINITY_DN80564_c0_g1_i1:194-2410(-)
MGGLLGKATLPMAVTLSLLCLVCYFVLNIRNGSFAYACRRIVQLWRGARQLGKSRPDAAVKEKEHRSQKVRQKASLCLAQVLLHYTAAKFCFDLFMLMLAQDIAASHLAEDLLFSVALAVMLLIGSACPKRHVRKIFNSGQVLLTLFWTLMPLVEYWQSVPLKSMTMSVCPRLFVGMVVCNPCLTCPCQGIIMGAQIAVSVMRGSPEMHSEILTEIGDSSLLAVLLIAYHSLFLMLSVQEAVPAPTESEITVRRLLSALCDAVVTLGPNLQIAEKAPKLANLLRQRQQAPRNQSLKGTNFLKFMTDPEKERFLRFVNSAKDWKGSEEDPEPAEALNIQLHDSGGVGVQVQLFHSLFRYRDNKVGHLIGIREAAEQTETLRWHGSQMQMQPHLARSMSEQSLNTERRGLFENDSNSHLGDSISVVAQKRQKRRELEQTGDSMSIISMGYSCSLSSSARDAQHETGSAAFDSVSMLGDSISVVEQKLLEQEQQTNASARSDEAVSASAGASAEAKNSSASQDVHEEEEETDLLGPLMRAPEISVAFKKMTFVVKDNRQSSSPVVNASLLDQETLLRWTTQWSSTKDWMQDFVNAVLRPLNADNWPPSAGIPGSLGVQVAFQASCRLPPDILHRPLPDASSNPCGDSRVNGPPLRLKVGRIKLSPKQRAEENRESRLRRAVDTPVRGRRRADSNSTPRSHSTGSAAQFALETSDSSGRGSELSKLSSTRKPPSRVIGQISL